MAFLKPPMTRNELLDKLRKIFKRLNRDYDGILENGCKCNCKDCHESLDIIHNFWADIHDIVVNEPKK